MRLFFRSFVVASHLCIFFNILLLLLSIFGCKSDSIDEDPSSIIGNIIDFEGDLEISDFVWKGLNEFYYWQEDVDDLSDDKLLDQKSYGQYISENPNAEPFFESLKHPDDRFSWIQDDYRVLENTLQGIVASNGVESVSYTHLTLPTIYSV